MRNTASWSGWPGGFGLTPTELNSAYPFGQFSIPAGALQPAEGDPTISTAFTFPIANGATIPVQKFTPGIETECYFVWQFKSDFMDAASLSLKIKPVWFQDVLGTGNVKWTAGAYVANIGDSLNVSNETNNQDQLCPARNALYEQTGGDAIDGERAIDLGNIGGVSASGWNHVSILLERHGDEAEDTFNQEAILHGIGVQFKCDFNNIAEWPVP